MIDPSLRASDFEGVSPQEFSPCQCFPDLAGHRQAGVLRSREETARASGPPRPGAAQEQPGRELAPADTPAGAQATMVQVARIGPAISVRPCRRPQHVQHPAPPRFPPHPSPIQSRGPTILPRYARRSKSLDVLLPILYLKGLSTGDFQDALAALLRKDAPGLSASTIGRLKEGWIAEHDLWKKRDLSARRYIYVGATASTSRRALRTTSGRVANFWRRRFVSPAGRLCRLPSGGFHDPVRHRRQAERRSKDDFKGRHFEAGLIVQAVS